MLDHLFFVMMGFGFLTKGPFALTFPLIPIVGCLWLYHEKNMLLHKSFLWGLLFMGIIVLPWPIFILRKHPDFLSLAFGETIGRAVTGFAHREPFYYYLEELVASLFPWLFFVPFSFPLVYSGRLIQWRKASVFLVFWFLGNLMFLSLLQSKRDYYMFPLMPAVALLTGSTWQTIWCRAGEKIGSSAALWKKTILAAGVICIGIAFVMDNPFAVNIPEMHFPQSGTFFLFLGMVIVTVILIQSAFPHLAIHNIIFYTVAIMMLGVHFLYFTYTVPIRNTEDSGKNFYRAVSHIVSRDTPLAFLSPYENYTFTFYARRPIVTLYNTELLNEFMSSPELRYVTMTNRNFRKIRPVSWKALVSSDFAEHRSWRGYVLLQNK